MTKINEIILKSGIKKQSLAQKLGVTNTTITRYCNGQSSPTVDTLIKISQILNVDISEFFLPINNTNT